ncbi:MAG TPA: tetratricopeptide repeat protein [Gemmataceae bacterium]|nr:tetratricopeptide repeat protein [Gemmataceae bacterium]
MSQDKPPARDSRVELFAAAALAALTLLVYSPTFHYPFVRYDDPDYVAANRHVQAGLSAAGARWAFTTFDCGNWHPLTWLSLQLDAELFGGPNAGGYHRTNVLLHAANAALLLLVLARMTGAVWRSAVVAGLFALHPLHVESVAWVAERKDVLSTLFWVLTLAAYLHYVRRPGAWRYLAVAASFALGLLAKPMLVTLPCVLLLLDYWPLRRMGNGEWGMGNEEHSPFPIPHSPFLEKVPLFALAGASCVVTYLAQSQGEAVASVEAIPPAARVGNALLAYVGYIGKALWPTRLAVYYPHPGTAIPVARALGAGLFLAVVTALVLGPGRRRPYLAVGWLWYLGTLVPVIGLVQVGGQAMADRYTYVPLIGLFLLLTWGVTDLALAWRLPRGYLAAAAAVALSACAALTWVQVGHWESNLRLWQHAAAVTEGNAQAHINLGAAYARRGQLSAARREYESAVAVNPRYAMPHFNLATVLAKMGRPAEALAEYRKAAELDPENAHPHNNLGDLLRSLGRPEEAVAEYRRAVALDRTDAYPHNNLGILLAELGRREESLAEFRRAVELAPEDPVPRGNLAAALQEEGRLDEALAEYRKTVELGNSQAGPRLRACERLRALRPRLPGLVAGRDRPADNAERLAFAELCRLPGERRYALAARLYADAFGAAPKLADDLGAAHRFRAAGAAAAAGCGEGVDSPGDKEKARLRAQALDWLRADLSLWAKQARGERPEGRAAARAALRAWQHDPRLAGVRDPAALAKLPGPEREAWQGLWREVGVLISTDEG